jgi:hypothetical protein
MEKEHKGSASRLIWIDVEQVVCAIRAVDFYRLVNKEPYFRDVVIMSDAHTLN